MFRWILLTHLSVFHLQMILTGKWCDMVHSHGLTCPDCPLKILGAVRQVPLVQGSIKNLHLEVYRSSFKNIYVVFHRILRVRLFGNFSILLSCLHIVLRYAFTILIHPVKIILGCGIATLRSFSIPLDRLCIVLRNTSAMLIHPAKIVLGFREIEPSSAAFRYHLTASVSSCGTPLPC